MNHLQSLRQNLSLRLGILLLMVPLTGATIDIYVPSLPAITEHFGTSVRLVQWTIPSYLVGYRWHVKDAGESLVDSPAL